MKAGQLIGILVILAVLLLGATYFVDNRSSENGPLPLAGLGSYGLDDVMEDGDTTIVTTEIIHIVEYADSGFGPNNLLITQGDSVRFMNGSDSLMWVTHVGSVGCENDSGIFDQCAPNKTFEYVFEEVGEWEFYNQLTPEHRGYITVQ